MAARVGRARKLVLLGSLYTTQFLALGFFITALPAILRERGVPLEQIGLLYLFGVVWVFKFMWAPLIDRFGSPRLGHYRGWLLVLQSLLVVCVLAMIPLDLDEDFGLLMVGIGVISLLSATQDIASDALAVGLLAPEERGLGNGVQLAGGLLGSMIGGGAVLLAYDFVGWTASMAVLAVGTALPLILVLRHQERAPARRAASGQTGFQEIWRLFRRPGMGRWAVLLLMYGIGLSLVYGLINPLLVDIGWSLAKISIVTVIIGSLVGISGGLLAGLSVRRLGRNRSLLFFGVVQVITLALFLPAAFTLQSGPLVYFGAGAVLFAYGATNTVLYTVMMDKCSPESPGTDYSSQSCLLLFGGIVASGGGVGLAGVFGYPVAVGAGVLFSAAAVFFATRVHLEDPKTEPIPQFAPAGPINPATD